MPSDHGGRGAVGDEPAGLREGRLGAQFATDPRRRAARERRDLPRRQRLSLGERQPAARRVENPRLGVAARRSLVNCSGNVFDLRPGDLANAQQSVGDDLCEGCVREIRLVFSLLH